MNAMHQARAAYASVGSPLRTDRSAEYQAFSEVIRRLSAAQAPEKFADLAGAIADNRALWTILAADVADAHNALPQKLRAQIFYLAEFTDLHSRKVLRGDADAQALIDINTAVMRGLSANAAAAATLQPAPTLPLAPRHRPAQTAQPKQAPRPADAKGSN